MGKDKFHAHYIVKNRAYGKAQACPQYRRVLEYLVFFGAALQDYVKKLLEKTSLLRKKITAAITSMSIKVAKPPATKT